MKKILHIYNSYYPPVIGGIEKHINSVCEGLKHKYKMYVLVSSGGMQEKREIINGINIIRMSEPVRLQGAPFCPRMPFCIRGISADILHFHLPCPSAVISSLVSRPAGRIIVTYHSDIVRQKKAFIIYRPLLMKFLKTAERIIATSPAYQKTSPVLRIFADKTAVIPLGVDTSYFRPGEKEEKDEPHRQILFVGKLRYYKGVPYLIEAMRHIKARLNIIGTGKEEWHLKTYARRNGTEKKINFLGAVPEERLRDYYSASSVLVLPSTERSEAFGIVQAEAMACGLPVISTRIDTGVPWVNKDGVTGLVVPPGDAQALALAVNRILNDESLRKQFGTNARLRAEREFSKTVMLNRISSIYE